MYLKADKYNQEATTSVHTRKIQKETLTQHTHKKAFLFFSFRSFPLKLTLTIFTKYQSEKPNYLELNQLPENTHTIIQNTFVYYQF